MRNASSSSSPVVAAFVRELLGSGLALTHLLEDLLEMLDEREEPPWPGEDCGAVLLEMVTGTIAGALRDVPAAAVEEATRLIGTSFDRVMTDLRMGSVLAGLDPAATRPQG
jgi:hypothetical protein